jgi:hypothetical protein
MNYSTLEEYKKLPWGNNRPSVFVQQTCSEVITLALLVPMHNIVEEIDRNGQQKYSGTSTKPNFVYYVKNHLFFEVKKKWKPTNYLKRKRIIRVRSAGISCYTTPGFLMFFVAGTIVEFSVIFRNTNHLETLKVFNVGISSNRVEISSNRDSCNQYCSSMSHTHSVVCPHSLLQ